MQVHLLALGIANTSMFWYNEANTAAKGQNKAMKWYGSIVNPHTRFHHLLNTDPDPGQFNMHTHSLLEIFYFVSGRGSYRVEGQMFDLAPGDILIMRPGETHSFLLERGVPYERVAIHISPQFLSGPLYAPLLEPFYQRPAGVGNRYRAEELPGAFVQQCMEQLFSTKPDGGDLQAMAYVLPLLQEISVAWKKRRDHLAAEPAQPAELSARMVDYINRHLTELDGMRQLEQQFFLSQSQLNRIFRRFTGTTVWEYVQIKRLFAAREMLYAGTPPHEAATACGYREYSTFFRAYKKRFAHSPQQDLGKGVEGKMLVES